jgi:hypothetical protein
MKLIILPITFLLALHASAFPVADFFDDYSLPADSSLHQLKESPSTDESRLPQIEVVHDYTDLRDKPHVIIKLAGTKPYGPYNNFPVPLGRNERQFVWELLKTKSVTIVGSKNPDNVDLNTVRCQAFKDYLSTKKVGKEWSGGEKYEFEFENGKPIRVGSLRCWT